MASLEIKALNILMDSFMFKCKFYIIIFLPVVGWYFELGQNSEV